MTVPCAHKRTGVVTSQVQPWMAEPGPHAESPVCDLPACIAEAKAWVQRMAHKPAFHVLDGES